MAELFSTRSVRQRDRFAYWREAICDSYVLLDCDAEQPQDFDGEIILNRLSNLSASFVSGSQQLVKRRRRDIARSGEESFLVSLQLEKSGVISQADRSAQLKPGDFALYSSVDRYVIDVPQGFKQLVIQIPRSTLLARIPQADLLTGITVPGQSAIGGIVHDSVTRLISSIDQSNQATVQALQDSVIDLVVTGLASLRETRYELSRPEQHILARADAAIRANIHNEHFDRSALAALLGLSVRRLSEIFQADQRSMSHTIREMRLNRIAADLRDLRNSRQSIGEIAYRWGISNQQSLVRSFKAQFGESPRAFRSRHKS